jgi:hypothetical protein
MFDHLKAIGTYVYESLAPFIEGVLVGAFKGLQESVPTLLTALNKVLTVLEAIAGAANAALDALDKVTAGKARGTIGGIIGKQLLGPLGSIPGMADGGIVTRPTLAMIGEGGQSEAVIPLDKLGRMGGGNTTININGGLASSADIGAAVVNAIRAFNRQNGPANIAVA